MRTLDLLPHFHPTYCVDILTFDPSVLGEWRPDIVLASPPCHGFSVMCIGKNWTVEHEPKTDTARLALRIVERTIRLVYVELRSRFFIMENPRAKLRKLPVVEPFERRTVTYCKYGDRRMKPTDLWGGFPPSLVLHPPCKNGDPCHVRAPRGSTTGTQGMDPEESAKIPEALALAVCLAAEYDLQEAHP